MEGDEVQRIAYYVSEIGLSSLLPEITNHYKQLFLDYLASILSIKRVESRQFKKDRHTRKSRALI